MKGTLWPDIAITLFAVVVAFIYFGGYFLPQPIGNWTGIGSLAYLLMVLLAAGWSVYGIFRRSRAGAASESVKKAP